MPGGGNAIVNNTIRRAALAGIAIIGCMPGAVVDPDVVAHNTVINVFGGQQTTAYTPCGSFNPTGVGGWLGIGDTIVSNAIIDTRRPALTWRRISLRAHHGGIPSVAVFAGNTATACAVACSWRPAELPRRAAGQAPPHPANPHKPIDPHVLGTDQQESRDSNDLTGTTGQAGLLGKRGQREGGQHLPRSRHWNRRNLADAPQPTPGS